MGIKLKPYIEGKQTIVEVGAFRGPYTVTKLQNGEWVLCGFGIEEPHNDVYFTTQIQLTAERYWSPIHDVAIGSEFWATMCNSIPNPLTSADLTKDDRSFLFDLISKALAENTVNP